MESEGLLPDELKEGSPAIGVTKDEDQDQTRVKQQLEALGFRVGGDLAERFVSLCCVSFQRWTTRDLIGRSPPAAGSPSPNLDSQTHWRSSSSSARTFGWPPSTNRSTTCGQITGCVPFPLPRR